MGTATFWEFPWLMLPAAAIFTVALLYSSVGHGGASGYLAVMSLFSMAPAALKPSALVLNIFVSAVAAWKFHQAGYFSLARLWPFAITSIPLAYWGGTMTLPPHFYRPLVGAVLLFSAARLLMRPAIDPVPLRDPPRFPALAWGGLFGLLSGLTGVGGGIFLSPLLIFKKWSGLREASATAAVLILVNSIAGLLGQMRNIPALPGCTPWLALGALAGGVIGAQCGSRRLSLPVISRILAVVLTLAGLKLLMIPL